MDVAVSRGGGGVEENNDHDGDEEEACPMLMFDDLALSPKALLPERQQPSQVRGQR